MYNEAGDTNEVTEKAAQDTKEEEVKIRKKIDLREFKLQFELEIYCQAQVPKSPEGQSEGIMTNQRVWFPIRGPDDQSEGMIVNQRACKNGVRLLTQPFPKCSGGPRLWEWRELVMNSLYKLICQAPRPFGGTTVVGVILLQPIFLEYAKI